MTAVLTAVFMGIGIVPVNAQDNFTNNTAVTEEVRERVYEEVLSGNITNEEDVIRVAPSQYEERKMTAARMNEMMVDESLSITQTVDEWIDADGHEMVELVTTSLVVFDEDENLVTAASIASGGQLSEYYIYATMSVNETNDRSAMTVRFNYFDTIISYGTSMRAGNLMQTSKYAAEPFFEYDDITKNIGSPQGGVSYRYVPSNQSMISYVRINTGRSCRSVISAGTKNLNVAYEVSCTYPGGYWKSEIY